MQKLNELVEIYEQKQTILSTKKFSEEVFNTHQDIAISANPTKVLDAYTTLKEIAGEYSQFLTFINKGLSQIQQLVIDRDLDYFLVKAANAYRLTEIYEYYNIEQPEWLPKTWRISSNSSIHKYTFLYDWSTVDPRSIAPKYHGYFIMKLNDELANRVKPSTLGSALSSEIKERLTSANFPKASEDEAESKVQPTDEISNIATEVATAPLNNVTEEVQPSLQLGVTSGGGRDEHSLFTCRKYLSLERSASKRNLDLTISVGDLEAMLRNPICHFTGETLVHFFHNPEDVDKGLLTLPANYLTIDRLDSNKGYIKGNVVLCGKGINELKDRMSNEEFQGAINMRRLMNTMNLTPEQIKIMTATA